MNFKEIYKDATVLTKDFLKNECAFEFDNLKPKEQEILFQQYYLNICTAINDLFYMQLSPSNIEALLESPVFANQGVTVSWLCSCRKGLRTRVTDANERKYLFIKATYDQIAFDIANGRTSMLRGEDSKWLIAPDALSKLDMLGFCQKTYATKW